MKKITANGLPIYQFENLLGCSGVTHFLTTRGSGKSIGSHGSLNLGLHVGDDPARVIENRLLLSSATEVPLESMVFCQQAHGAGIALVDRRLRGRGSVDFAAAISGTDALVTADSDVCLMVLVADCVPVLMFDPFRRVAAAVHSGWRGTVGRVAQEAVKRMTAVYGSNPFQIVAGIGPSIGPACYEVGSEVAEAVEAAALPVERIMRPASNGKATFDLCEAVRLQLLEAGLLASNIETAGLCTHCHPDEFYSVRRQNGVTGRIAAGIYLVPAAVTSPTHFSKSAA